MATNNNDVSINLGVVDNTQSGLDSALTNLTKFTAKATKDSVITINARLGKDFLGDVSKIQSRMRKFSFEGIFSSAQGKNMWEKKIDFSKEFINGLNFEGLKNAEEQLLFLKKMLDDKRAVSKGTWTDKQYKDLQKLIELIQRAKGEYSQLQKSANAGANKQKGVVNAMVAQETTFSKLISLARRYFNIFAVANFGKQIADTTKYFEQQQVALEGILGSAVAASDAIARIKTMAMESPLQTHELITDVKEIAAYGIEQEKLLDTTKQLADISVGLGVSMDRLILAYGQVKAAAVLRGQELRQFTEAGIPMVQALADKFTQLNGRVVTTGEVFKLISQRQVSFEMVAEVLSDMTKEGGKFYKMQERMTDTLYGQMEKTADMWTIAKNSLGEMTGGLLMGIVKMLQLIVKNAKAFLVTISAPVIILSLRRISGYFDQIQANFGRLPQIMRRVNALMSVATTSARKWHIAMAGIKVAANAAIGAIMLGATILTSVISNAILKAREFNDALAEIDRSFNKDTNSLKNGLDSILYKLAANTNGTHAFNEALETLKNNYKDFINPSVIDALVAEKEQIDITTKSWQDLRESIIAAIDARQKYERDKAKRQKAGDLIAEENTEQQFNKKISRLASNLITQNNANISKTGYDIAKVRDDAAELLGDAVSEFFAKGLEDKSELKKIFRENAKYYGKIDVANLLDPFFEDLTSSIFKGRKWNKYLKFGKTIQDSLFFGIDSEFEKARAKITGFTGSDIGNEAKIDEEAISAAVNAISNLKITGEDVNDMNKFNEAVERLKSETSEKWDYGQTKRVADVFEELRNVVTDNVFLASIDRIAESFGGMTNQRSGTAKAIADNIEDYLKTHSPIDPTLFRKYLPSDKTLIQNRDAIEKRYAENEAFMKEHKATGVWKDEYEKSKSENEILKILGGSNMFDIDFNKKNKSSGQYEPIPTELTEFVNNMKTAYKVYKKATGGMGAQMGLGFMKNDTKMQEQFGGFFSDAFDSAFKDEQGNIIKIAGRSVKDILTDAFEKGGLEDGVLNFEKGMRAVAKALDEYAGNSKYRKQFKNMAKEAVKWADQMAKDNVDARIKAMNTELEKLTKTFSLNTKQVEVYRKLMEKGIAPKYGNGVGATSTQALTPDSVMARELVKDILSKINSQAANVGVSPFEVGDISSYKGVNEAIQKFSDMIRLQNGNIEASGLGQLVNQLINALEQVRNAYENEYSKLSGKTFTGDVVADAIANAATNLRGAQGRFALANTNPMLNGKTDQGAVEEYLRVISENANNIFDALKKRMSPEAITFNRPKGMFDIFKGINAGNVEEDFKKKVGYNQMPESMQVELRQAFRELQDSIDNFNANYMAFGSVIGSIRTAANAKDDAARVYANTEAEYNAALNKRDQVSESQSEYTSPEEFQAALVEAEAKVAALREELDRLGENGENLARNTYTKALNNISKSAGNAQQMFGNMSGAVTGIVQAFRSFMNVIRKVYDTMNDGENPKWMEQLDSYLEDFIENFEALIAPISAIIGLIGSVVIMVLTLTGAIEGLETACVPLLIMMAAIIATAAIIAAIIAAVQAHDKALQRQIEDLDKHIKDLENEAKNLNDMAERMTGWEKFGKQLEATSKKMDEAFDSLKQYTYEVGKHNTDTDKAKEYYQNWTEAINEFINSVKDMNDELTSSVDDWASAITDSLRNAFQSGENAARNMRDTVKEMIGDIINNMINMTVVQPLMEHAMETLLGGTTEELAYAAGGDPKKYVALIRKQLTDTATLNAFEEEVMNIQDAVMEFGDTLGNAFDYWTYNSELSSLQGGIENITEDTARRLEALSNSQLGETILIRKSMELMAYDVTTLPSIRAEAVKMNSTLAAMLVMSTRINQAIEDMRNNVRPLHVVM